MAILIAIAHIFGALFLFAGIAFGDFISRLQDWQIERSLKSQQEEISIALGIPVDEIYNTEHKMRVVQFMAERFSSELFCNRLSDLCELMQTIWNWLGRCVFLGTLFGIILFTIKDDLSYGVYAWWLIPIALFFWLSSLLFTLVCELLTGRFPGQAKQSRENLTEFIKQKNT
jgi:hypothetical protein